MERTREIRIESDSILIYQPRFVDEERQKVKAIARLVDGRLVELDGNRNEANSNFIRDVFSQYTESEIVAFTERENRVVQLKRQVDEQAALDRQRAEENEITFQAKAKALALPEVQNCSDKRVSRRIRRSKSAFEVAGWLAVAFARALDQESGEAEKQIVDGEKEIDDCGPAQIV